MNFNRIIDFIGIDTDYFTILFVGEDCFDIMSKNTGHKWRFVYIEENKNAFKLYHAHHLPDPWHVQGYYKSVKDGISHIIWHDGLVLHKKQNKVKVRKYREWRKYGATIFS